ncbi:hypothetical protein N0V90_010436 [Kalmusia sp. IMI 367209]|nr:hypothetical protein N0V90_010436 [Kalmusia sp. IMI 367209]
MPQDASSSGYIVDATSTSTAPARTHISRIKERLRTLEGLVKQFSHEIDETYSVIDAPTVDILTSISRGEASGSASQAVENTDTVPRRGGGRFVGLNASRYVTSSFWNRIDEELAGLRADTQNFAEMASESSEDDAPPHETTTQPPRLLSNVGVFPFGSNLDAPMKEYRPLASHIPYLLDVYEANVNFFVRVVHMPSFREMTRDQQAMVNLTPDDEALLFAVYYAAIASMEDEDVMTNFGISKPSLTARFRLGLETSLSQADFLNSPTLSIVQALTLFLGLHRRHDSPKYVWMMFGLLARIAQYLGLHRDGSHLPHLTPFEIEMRRRTWWTMCLVDQKTAEDQGTGMTYASIDFDTKAPLNINDQDIDPQTTTTPTERFGVTDTSFVRISVALTEIHRQLLSSSPTMTLDEKSRIIEKIYQNFESQYLRYTSQNIGYWVSITMARMVMAKLTLLSFLPVITSPSPSTSLSPNDIALRTKLLHAAIHVAEFNHAMNAEEACRHWRWAYQTCTHWHSTIYLALEIPRRVWSPVVERAWVALNSRWLIPPRALSDDTGVWLPIRKLMRNARRHRDAELARLRADPEAARMSEMQDAQVPFSSHPAPFSTTEMVDVFVERWRRLVGIVQTSTIPSAALDDPLILFTYSAHPGVGGTVSGITPRTQKFGISGQVGDSLRDTGTASSQFADMELTAGDTEMEFDSEADWQAWIESALNTELHEEH